MPRLRRLRPDDGAGVEIPGELLATTADAVLRGVRTQAMVQLGAGWVWPFWLHRQLDPRSPAFVARGELPTVANLTQRNWTKVGNLRSALVATVDPRGLVTPRPHGWSLDWWIGADDRWHLPSVETAVRQQLVDGAPVVETAMRVPGGDAVQRACALSGREGRDDDLVVVEVENQSAVPFAVAVAVRPYGPEGLATVERIAFDGGTVFVDGRAAMRFGSRGPALSAGSTFAEGDVVSKVTTGSAGTLPEGGVHCPDGLASAAFLFPLAHRASLRIALPLGSEDVVGDPGRRRSQPAPGVAPGVEPVAPAALPSAADVARGWRAQTQRGMRLELPDPRLAEAVEANRRFLLLQDLGDGPGLTGGGRSWFLDAASVVGARARYGFPAEAAVVLRSYPALQHPDGSYGGLGEGRPEVHASGAALYALAEHWRLTGDLDPVDGESVARCVAWVARARDPRSRRTRAPSPRGGGSPGSRSPRPGPELQGLMPAGSSDDLGPSDFSYRDDFWSLRGLLDGARLLAAVDQQQAADDTAEAAHGLRRDLLSSLALVAERLGTPAVPTGPRRRIDSAVVSSLVACAPLGLLAPDDPAMIATAEVVRERFCVGDACYQGVSRTGLGTAQTLQLAAFELEAGDGRALDRLRWLLGAATPTWTWPEAIHPQLGGGCTGEGHSGRTGAEFLSFVRNLLVRETGGGLALCTLVPDSWRGQGIEVHDAPTHHGQLSYAVRWHGERPALLWQLEPRGGGVPVRVTAPGLDPSWSSSELRGEALLAAAGPSSTTGAPTSRRSRPAPAPSSGGIGEIGEIGDAGSFS